MHEFAHDVGMFVLVGALGIVLTIVGMDLEARLRDAESWLARRWRERGRRCEACGRPVRNAPPGRIRAGEAFGSTDRTARFVCRTCHAVHAQCVNPAART